MFQDVTECHNISGANSECHPITLTYLSPMPNVLYPLKTSENLWFSTLLIVCL